MNITQTKTRGEVDNVEERGPERRKVVQLQRFKHVRTPTSSSEGTANKRTKNEKKIGKKERAWQVARERAPGERGAIEVGVGKWVAQHANVAFHSLVVVDCIQKMHQNDASQWRCANLEMNGGQIETERNDVTVRNSATSRNVAD